MIEGGVPGYEVGSWFGIFLPAGVSRGMVAKLNEDVVRTLRQPAMIQMFRTQGFEMAGGSAEDFHKFVRAETAKFAKVVKAAGVKVE